MSETNRPDYRVVAEFYRDNHRGERQRGTQDVGAAWIGATKEGVQPINVVVNAFPNAWDGRLTLWPIEEAAAGDSASSTKSTTKSSA